MKAVLYSALCALAAGALQCSGTPNTQPVYTGAPRLVAQVPNGLKYVVQPSSNYTNPLIVVHVYGTPYDMGYAYGQMLRTEMKTMFPLAYDYLAQKLNSTLPAWIPAVIRNLIINDGPEVALDFTFNATKPFTPAHHYETLQGMADGSGLDFMYVARISMIPELIKAQCSMLGAWGPATAQVGGGLVQLRALDWETGGPFQRFPTVTVWHPEAGNGYPFSTLGFSGMLGALTGVSSTGMGISEKLWDSYNGVQNVFGYVWNFLLQDILQYDWDTDLALSRVASANRTCSFWIGLGDKVNNHFKAIGYSNQEVLIYNDRNYPSYPNHDLFTNLVFIDKHVQPSGNPCMNQLMHAYYGQIDALNVLQYVTAQAQTGDMHIQVTDYANELIYVSNAAPVDANGNAVPAYVRPFIRLNLTELWQTPNPTGTRLHQ